MSELVSCQGSNAACSLALKPDGVVASRRHSPSYDSSSRLASGLDGGAIKRHLSPDTTLALIRVGLVSVSDRASSGVYEDRGTPALKEWLGSAVRNPIDWQARLIPDDENLISETLRELVDDKACHLVFTTGGTGPAQRDVTPEATLAVADRVMEGFGEQMRQISLRFVPTAILSRQVGVIRGKSLIVNLPGQPKSIAQTLQGLPEAQPPVHGIFAAIPYCIDLLGGPFIETHDALCKAFRPASASR